MDKKTPALGPGKGQLPFGSGGGDALVYLANWSNIFSTFCRYALSVL